MQLGRLAPLPAVAAAADAVHRDGEHVLGLRAEGAQRHGGGHEAGKDGLDRLDLREGDRRPRPHLEQVAYGERRPGVDQLRVAPVLERPPRAHGRVERLHDPGLEGVRLAFLAVAVKAALVQVTAGRGECLAVAREHVVRQLLQVRAAEVAGGAAEVGGHQLVGQPHDLHELRAVVGAQGRDAHLGDDLEQSLLQAGQVALRSPPAGVRELAARFCRRFHRLQGQVGTDRLRPEGDERGDLVVVAGLAGLDDEARAHPEAPPHEVLVDGGDGQERRQRCPLRVHAAVG